MPQLDKITFLSQFFWLSFFYLGFYFLIYKYFLPKMSRVLKFRKRKMNTSQEGVTHMGQESDKVGNSYQTLLSTGLTTCKSAFNQNFKGAEDWLNNTVSEANQTRLKNTNQTYISSLGERSISQRLVITQAFVDVSEKARFALLISKFRSLKKANYSTLGEKAAKVDSTFEGTQRLKLNKAKSSEKKNSVDIGKNKTKQHKEQEQVAQKAVVAEGKTNKAGAKSSVNKENKGKSNKKR